MECPKPPREQVQAASGGVGCVGARDPFIIVRQKRFDDVPIQKRASWCNFAAEPDFAGSTFYYCSPFQPARSFPFPDRTAVDYCAICESQGVVQSRDLGFKLCGTPLTPHHQSFLGKLHTRPHAGAAIGRIVAEVILKQWRPFILLFKSPVHLHQAKCMPG